MNQINKMLKESLYVHKELKADESKSAYYRWKNKPVLDSETLYDGSSLDNITYNPCATVNISHDFYLTSGSCLKLIANNDVENVIPRPWPSIHYHLGGKDLSKYNRMSFDIYLDVTGYQGFYVQFAVGNELIHSSHCEYLLAKKWNHVIFELDCERNNCKEIIISPWLTGTAPEATKDYIFYLDNIKAEIVDADYVLGWESSLIAYNHAGYGCGDQKIAVTSNYQGDEFKLIDDKKNEYIFNVRKLNSNLGEFYLLDFSSYVIEGTYYLEYGKLKTESFLISNNHYDETIWKSLNFLRLLRCGCDIQGVHSACHLNCRSVHPLTKATVPNFGGWHDAGDVSQFEIPTAEMAHAIMDLASNVKDSNPELYERLKEEARVGVNWLQQTRFGDGYRALAVTYSIWRKYVLEENNKTIYTNEAEFGTFENFLSACALAKAYELFIGDDDIYADWCLRSAISDYEFAVKGYNEGLYSKRWGPTIDSVTCGSAVTASVLLYKATLDKSYIDQAVFFADIIVSCQEQSYVGSIHPIRGFFYEDPHHEWVLTYEHRGHEQSPIQGLVDLCLLFKENNELFSGEKFRKFNQAIELYKEYVLSSMEYSKPYGLLPGHVYILGKTNYDRFTIPSSYGTKDEGKKILDNQIKAGINLGDNVYLRILPIAVQRRGYHATLLSKTKAVSMMAKYFNDDTLKNIANDQIAWVLGKNPFASSTMYGVGNNYHPLYTAFSRQMVGALPVGIMTKGDFDMPYWPTADGAVYKEIWGHTTGKYLWILADLLKLESKK